MKKRDSVSYRVQPKKKKKILSIVWPGTRAQARAPLCVCVRLCLCVIPWFLSATHPPVSREGLTLADGASKLPTGEGRNVSVDNRQISGCIMPHGLM